MSLVVPVRENVGDRDMAGYGERQVQVGEAIATVHSERTHDGSGYDAVIGLPEPQHAFAESIPLLDGKHAYCPRSLFRMVELKSLTIHNGSRN
jgi:hypothetical protein